MRRWNDEQRELSDVRWSMVIARWREVWAAIEIALEVSKRPIQLHQNRRHRSSAPSCPGMRLTRRMLGCLEETTEQLRCIFRVHFSLSRCCLSSWSKHDSFGEK